VGRLTDRHDHPGAAVLEQTHSHRWTSCIEDGGCVTAGRCRTESPPSALDPAPVITHSEHSRGSTCCEQPPMTLCEQRK
jgi:hypothetical protein